MKKRMPAAMLLASLVTGVACLMAGMSGCSSGPSESPPPGESDNEAIARTVRANSTTLRTIEPGGSDFSDLEAFGRAVGDRSIVILGEPTHGDGDIFKLKTRLVEYLHQAKGFDVLIVESGMFDMARIQERHVAEGVSYSALSPGRMFFMYSRSDDGQRVLKYVDATQASSRPLQLSGFDISMGGDSSIRELVPKLTDFLASRGSGIAAGADWASYRDVANQVAALTAAPRPSDAQTAAFKRVTALLDGELCAAQPDDFNFTRSPGFWCRIIRSIDAGHERLWGPVDLRDTTGGDNVKWLLDRRFAGKKVVLWMHSFHGINGQTFPPSGPTWISVGTRLVQLYGDHVFMTHFTAGAGSYDAYLAAGTAPTLAPLGATTLEHHFSAVNAPQFMRLVQDPVERQRINALSVFEPQFIMAARPNHFGAGYQGVFYIPATRAIFPEADKYPLFP